MSELHVLLGFMGEKSQAPGFCFFLNKILGTGIYTENFLGATRPIKTLTCVLMGGADGVLGGEGKFAVGQT